MYSLRSGDRRWGLGLHSFMRTLLLTLWGKVDNSGRKTPKCHSPELYLVFLK